MLLSRSLLFSAATLASLTFAGDVVLTPLSNSDSSKGDIGIIMMQGADINNTAYVPLFEVVQSTFSNQGYNNPLYVGLPAAPFEAVNPTDITELLKDSYNELVKAGMDPSAPVFVAGHSLGGAMIQLWVGEHQTDYQAQTGIENLKGQILMGSFIQRKWRSNLTQFLESDEYTIPTATLSGTLDGLCRVTRIAEECYIQAYDDRFTTENIANYPVFIIEGMSHMQFASGVPPTWVRLNDLQPEISYDEAHQTAADLISAFITVQLSNQYNTEHMKNNDHTHHHYPHKKSHSVSDVVSNSFTTMKNAQQSSNDFSEALVAGFNAEGFYHFIQPCDCHLQICNPDTTVQPYCIGGSYWTSTISQPTMATLPDGTKSSFIVTDSFHPVQQVEPVHLSHIYTDPCDSPNDSSCVLNITTVSENHYDELDSTDTGFYSTAAIEVRSKMSSRQRVWYYAGYKDAEFNETDTNQNCAQINELSYEWALNHAGTTTINRYNEYGEYLRMGDDHDVKSGPSWIYEPLRFERKTDAQTGVAYRSVVSTALATALDFPIEASAGFHYCKVLSPAKAMEWIYIDGLRYNLSINNDSSQKSANEFHGYSGDERTGFYRLPW